MRRRWLLAAVVLLPAGTRAAAGDIVFEGKSGSAVTISEAALMRLPFVEVHVSGGHGAVAEGPLLWTLLLQAHAVDGGNPRQLAGQAVRVTGSDGYSAVLALGEIAPAFEGKSVILAERMDSKPLAPGHFRLVVPGDRGRSRSVRDVVRVTALAGSDKRGGL